MQKAAIAQYESANWIFGEYALQFSAEPPAITAPVFSNNDGEFASYSSDFGQLLIATDGSTVWNGAGEIMKNGVSITPYRTRSIIIPKPGSNNQYYIFSYNAFNVPGNNNNTLSVIVYSIVDLAANNNKGEVIEKNKVLYNNTHGTFTISGKCDRSVFWLVGDVDTNVTEGSDKIYVFQIDKNGIQGPFTSKPMSIGNGSNYKLSPDAKKLLITVNDVSGAGSLITDFRPEILPADPIVKTKYLPATGGGEFSSSGRFIYMVASNRIIQYDIQTETWAEIFSSIDFLGLPQMAANGKIYIPVDGKKKLAVINKPDLPGLSCDFSESGISVPAESFVLPSFASNLFYYKEFSANAGSDKVICSGESIMIGSEENNAASFLWSPASYLDDPTKLQPTFQYTGSDNTIESFTYKLTASFEGCQHNDLVVIKINSIPPLPPIYGSQSVCPGVEGVQYWTDRVQGSKYLWTISGGIIVGVTDLDTITVSWATANATGRVALQISDGQLCKSEFAMLDVLINAELKTETPKGPDSVCVNLKSSNHYQVTKTNGSVYEWGISGGEIISDPTFNKVFVSWEADQGKIWVNEKNITNEATCFGKSDTLNIIVFKDPSAVHLDYVTLDEREEQRIHLQASMSYNHRIKEVRILSSIVGTGVWEEVGTPTPSPVIIFSADNFQTDHYAYQFQIDILNKCGERSASSIHNTILLKAGEKEESNFIDLQWSSYEFWTAGGVSYELLQSLKEPLEFSVVETIVEDTITSIPSDKSFLYFLRVKAVRSDGLFSSLSNDVRLEFKHELVIPNVITPNKDGFNDTFEIKNIKLYPFSRLIILSRYGQSIFDKLDYQGGWDGEDQPSGVYYYTLQVPQKQKEYKGWLHIVR